MPGISVTTQVSAPIERVFDVFTDLRAAPERVQAIQSLEVLTEGPVGVGTRFREARVMFGREATEEMEITTFEPNKRYVVICDNHGCEYRSEFSFKPDSNGTTVTMTFEAKPHTLAAKLMSPLGAMMMKSVKKECARDMENLKLVAEGGVAGG